MPDSPVLRAANGVFVNVIPILTSPRFDKPREMCYITSMSPSWLFLLPSELQNSRQGEVATKYP
jgi:hypothetical protein